MKKLQNYSILLVKYSSNVSPSGSAWCEYKAKKGRNLKSVQKYFSRKSNFRFIYIYDYSPNSGRGAKTGYIDRYKIEYLTTTNPSNHL